jgi:hypothetical protein
MNKDGADIIIHELSVEITGYQTEIEMTEFLASQRKKPKLTKEEKQQIQAAKNRLKRLEFAQRILIESFYPDPDDGDEGGYIINKEQAYPEG